MSTSSDRVKFIRGRTASSINATYEGYRYSRDGMELKDGSQAWRCVLKNQKCPARIYTIGDTLFRQTKTHCHLSNFIDTEVREIISEAKDLAVSIKTRPTDILSNFKTVSSAVKLHLPDSNTWKSSLHYCRRTENTLPPAPKSLYDLVETLVETLVPEKVVSDKNEPMLLYDNKSPEARAIIFGTQKNLDVLKRCPSWYINGTFKVSPQLFYQLITVHEEIPDFSNGNPWTFPLVYILLTHKDADIYMEAFSHLATLRDFSPDTVMVDFEPALRKSISTAFPSASVDGCFFHFCQATLRWLYNNGLKRSYEKSVNNPTTGKLEHSEIRVWVRRIQMLAFVPVDEVVSTFMFLQDHIPANLGLDDFLEYFESTWIQGASTSRRAASARFPPTSWNCVERTLCHISRTNNTLEAFNRYFAAKVGHSNPTIWNFLSAMFLEQTDTDAKILKESHGDRPPAKKRRQQTKDRRIHHIVSTYDLDTFPLDYLDRLRNANDGTD